MENNFKEEIFKTVTKLKRVNSSMIFAGVTHREFFTMEILYEESEKNNSSKGVQVSKLADILKISLPQASRLLKNMEEKKYVIRTIDEDNRRNTYVEITGLGLKKRLEASKRMEIYISKVIGRMGMDNVGTLLLLLNDMTTIMKEELDNIKSENNTNNKQ